MDEDVHATLSPINAPSIAAILTAFSDLEPGVESYLYLRDELLTFLELPPASLRSGSTREATLEKCGFGPAAIDKMGSDRTPVFLLLGAYRCPLQNIVYAFDHMSNQLDFWWVKPEVGNPGSLNTEYLSKNKTGEWKNSCGYISFQAHKKLADVFNRGGVTTAPLFGNPTAEGREISPSSSAQRTLEQGAFGIEILDRIPRAYFERGQNKMQRSRCYLILIWQSSFSAYAGTMEGWLIYHKVDNSSAQLQQVVEHAGASLDISKREAAAQEAAAHENAEAKRKPASSPEAGIFACRYTCEGGQIRMEETSEQRIAGVFRKNPMLTKEGLLISSQRSNSSSWEETAIFIPPSVLSANLPGRQPSSSEIFVDARSDTVSLAGQSTMNFSELESLFQECYDTHEECVEDMLWSKILPELLEILRKNRVDEASGKMSSKEAAEKAKAKWYTLKEELEAYVKWSQCDFEWRL